MLKEIIVIQQEIIIEYNSPEAKELAINKVLESTDWIAFSEGVICNKEHQYGASKTKNIKLITQ